MNVGARLATMVALVAVGKVDCQTGNRWILDVSSSGRKGRICIYYTVGVRTERLLIRHFLIRGFGARRTLLGIKVFRTDLKYLLMGFQDDREILSIHTVVRPYC